MPQISFHEPYHFAPDPATIARFPFPFDHRPFAYRMNLSRHDGTGGEAFRAAFDVDAVYEAELAEKSRVLAADPERCAVKPDMLPAQWEALALMTHSLARDFPGHFTLEHEGGRQVWHNRRLGLRQSFVPGDADTLPCPPFEYIARQMQGDFTLHRQHAETITLDGGMVTQPADWSLAADLGMDFHTWHAPVPAAAAPVFDAGLRALLRLREAMPLRRTNWSLTVFPRLDTSPETRHAWIGDRHHVTAANVGARVHLRVEVQALFRLMPSAAILFSIRTYLLALRDVARNPVWAERLAAVLEQLDPAIVAYKGLGAYRAHAVDFLRGRTSC